MNITIRCLVAACTVTFMAYLAAFGSFQQELADPAATSQLPHPDWLLQMFFQVTRYCQDADEMRGVFWLPVSILLVMALLPLIDRIMPIGKNLLKWLTLLCSLALVVGWGALTYHTGSTTPIDSCTSCHQENFGEALAVVPSKVDEFSNYHDNKWLSLHYRHPQYFWMVDAKVPKW